MFIEGTIHRLSRAFALLVLALCALGVAHAQTVAPRPSIKTIGDFETCHRQGYTDEQCLLALEALVRVSPGDAMRAGKVVRLNFNSSVALRFFEIAAKQKHSDFCLDQDVQLAVRSGLALPDSHLDAMRARTLFADPCFAEQSAAVVKELGGESRDSYLSKNACPILEKRQQAPASCHAGPDAQTKALASPAKKLPPVDKSAIALGLVKVYSGREGERVTMAPIRGTDLLLIRFDGVDSPWNSKVVLHQQVDLGNDSVNYWTEHTGARWNSVARRNGMLTVYLPEFKSQNGFAVRYAERLSQEADAKALLQAYQP